ncbi:MAG: hypothetical protein ACLP7J_13460 [Streptosporangiaceae bacterium]
MAWGRRCGRLLAQAKQAFSQAYNPMIEAGEKDRIPRTTGATDSPGRPAVEISRFDTSARQDIETYEDPTTGATLESAWVGPAAEFAADLSLSTTCTSTIPADPCKGRAPRTTGKPPATVQVAGGGRGALDRTVRLEGCPTVTDGRPSGAESTVMTTLKDQSLSAPGCRVWVGAQPQPTGLGKLADSCPVTSGDRVAGAPPQPLHGYPSGAASSPRTPSASGTT